MLGLTTGEAVLVALLIFGVVSAKFWPAAGARLAERWGGGGAPAPKSERTNDGDST